MYGQDSPIEVFQSLLFQAVMGNQYSRRGPYGKIPGALISKMNPERRALLAGLRSDDVAKMWCYVDDDEATARRKAESALRIGQEQHLAARPRKGRWAL